MRNPENRLRMYIRCRCLRQRALRATLRVLLCVHLTPGICGMRLYNRSFASLDEQCRNAVITFAFFNRCSVTHVKRCRLSINCEQSKILLHFNFILSFLYLFLNKIYFISNLLKLISMRALLKRRF